MERVNLFTLAYLVLGANGAFQPGTYDVSVAWLVLAPIVAAVAGVVGGLVCKLIARTSGASLALVALVLVLGVASAVAGMNKVAPAARAGDVQNLAAMRNAKTPTWMMLLMPVIGAVGVLAGARLKGDSES